MGLRLSWRDRFRIWMNKGYFLVAMLLFLAFSFGSLMGAFLQKYEDLKTMDVLGGQYNTAMDLYSTCNESLRICTIALQDDEKYISELKIQCPNEKTPL